MMPQLQRRAGTRGAVAMLLTLAVHLLWWAALQRSPAPHRSSAARVSVRLIPWAIPHPLPQPTSEAPMRMPHRPPASPARIKGFASVPLSTAPGAPGPVATQGTASPAVAASAAEPLDLQWRREVERQVPTVREQALNDARSNTPHLSPAQRLAQSLGGDDALVEESLGDGRVRVRKGRACLELRDSRGAGIDPFNGSLRPAPKLAGSC